MALVMKKRKYFQIRITYSERAYHLKFPKIHEFEVFFALKRKTNSINILALHSVELVIYGIDNNDKNIYFIRIVKKRVH